MLLRLFIAALSLFAAEHSALAANGCPSPAAIESHLQQHLLQLQPLLQSIPAELKISYQNINLPINGYAHLSGERNAEIKIAGNQCPAALPPDALSVLLCHEIGHLAGGAPFMKFAGDKSSLQISAEGQADFFATSSCLPSLWRTENNSESLAQISAHQGLEKACPSSLDSQERSLCARIAIASKGFQDYNYALALSEAANTIPPRSPGAAPSFENHDSSITPRTLTREYPKLQCRLDTMLAGLKCQAPSASNFTAQPGTPLACGEVAAQATRPACWLNAK